MTTCRAYKIGSRKVGGSWEVLYYHRMAMDDMSIHVHRLRAKHCKGWNGRYIELSISVSCEVGPHDTGVHSIVLHSPELAE